MQDQNDVFQNASEDEALLARLFPEGVFVPNPSAQPATPKVPASPAPDSATPAAHTIKTAERQEAQQEQPAQATESTPSNNTATAPASPSQTEVAAPQAETPIQASDPASDEPTIIYSGQMNNGTAVLFHLTTASELLEADRAFLAKVLVAVGLELKDSALVNIALNQGLTIHDVIKQLEAKKVLIFEANPALQGLPIHAVPYQPIAQEGYHVLLADKLRSISQNVHLKKQLWAALTKLYKIS